METSEHNVEILKLFSEIISQTINEIDSFQIIYLNKEKKETRLTIGKDILIIHVVGYKEECSMKDIIHATGLPNSTATRRVGYLVKKQLLIRRISKKDKRKTIIKLTRNGRKAFSSFFDYISHIFEEPLKIIKEKDKELIIQIFKILLKKKV
ncbi:MarR family winged helix-turn-helix transcriptional regulator [Promethearchaeum syntrophicum]|uniref:MarR family winged helix-turn-helix transcriptional regulator n=1 Tax=Promethearchaeum syntrophicum TaxID=2594042 RepID=A0A5B9D6G9_9ARCH|nr:MarR family transcriptional regulator [Candidatus Prometheoarchaeum syntrophicum]QEE14593.1 hypothetical protein DSAG12_00406 [Candidatus Prometheoarchaeum syntrophicum]